MAAAVRCDHGFIPAQAFQRWWPGRCGVSCGFSAVSDDLHAARWYSLISPPRTLCRRIDAAGVMLMFHCLVACLRRDPAASVATPDPLLNCHGAVKSTSARRGRMSARPAVASRPGAAARESLARRPGRADYGGSARWTGKFIDVPGKTPLTRGCPMRWGSYGELPCDAGFGGGTGATGPAPA